MNSLYLPLSRIILRYLTAFAFSAGALAPEMAEQIGTDPDLIMVVSVALATLVEFGYYSARKYGGAT